MDAMVKLWDVISRKERITFQAQHRHHPQAHFQVRIDAAGQYAANLESFLRSLDLPMTLSIGEPKRNTDYQKTHYPKRTTDDTESQAMARFAVVEQPTVLHRVVMGAVLLTDAEDRYDVGVVQACCGPSLALEALDVHGMLQGFRWQHLQGHAPAERLLLGFMDHSHAAAANLSNDAVIPQVGIRVIAGAGAHRYLGRCFGSRANHQDEGGEQLADLPLFRSGKVRGCWGCLQIQAPGP